MKLRNRWKLEALGAMIVVFIVVSILILISPTTINWGLQVERTADEYRMFCWHAPCLSPAGAIAISALFGLPVLFAGILAIVSDHKAVKQ